MRGYSLKYHIIKAHEAIARFMFMSPLKRWVYSTVKHKCDLHQITGCIKLNSAVQEINYPNTRGQTNLARMYKSMKSSWIKTSYPLSVVGVGGGEEKMGKWGEEIQQSLTDKAQCTISINSLCSDKKGRVKKGRKSKTEEAFLKSYRGLREKWDQ